MKRTAYIVVLDYCFNQIATCEHDFEYDETIGNFYDDEIYDWLCQSPDVAFDPTTSTYSFSDREFEFNPLGKIE